ncbi:Membrane protein involved in the export of O-antigen and teichoic acid [Pseudidiomarina indica]|uniref:Membrane protein involved in the export of O-antigen and teichoic acid n=1 Tax=Pseudidiomarina indica TaxID=1159017 RepID=A0A1G6AUV9_9GAMM|nr:oligosaccharide flippase family protein [Pseudidiomarina indica]SDB12171.1 Membrane protein involved in the export of O-antigen and teichoic acid [Pseudidiomarina indica]
MFSKIKQRILADKSIGVLKGMLILLVGAGIARIIGLMSIPILTRIYSPEDYGVLALYTSIVTVLAPFMTLRYVLALPLPNNGLLALGLRALCLKLIFLASIIFSIVLYLFGEPILVWLNMEQLVDWRWLIVLGASGVALYELSTLWATRYKFYKKLARAQFVQSLVLNSSQIILGLFSIKPLGMLIGHFASQVAGVLSLTKTSQNNLNISAKKLSWKKKLLIAKYYQGFVWFRLPSHVLMVFSIQAPVMMMVILFGTESTGQFSLAMLALSLPISIMGSAMSKAYYAEIASLGKNNIDIIYAITLSVQKKLFYVGIPSAAIVYFISESLFGFLFGAEWAMAGKFASILAPFVLFQFTSSPLMEAINVLGKQYVYLILNIVRLIGLIMIFKLAGYIQLTDEKFVGVISIYLSVFYCFASVLVVLMIKNARSRG